jgi:hypothetical protein
MPAVGQHGAIASRPVEPDDRAVQDAQFENVIGLQPKQVPFECPAEHLVGHQQRASSVQRGESRQDRTGATIGVGVTTMVQVCQAVGACSRARFNDRESCQPRAPITRAPTPSTTQIQGKPSSSGMISSCGGAAAGSNVNR